MKTQASKFNPKKRVMIDQSIYRKLQMDSDKTGFPIDKLINMYLNNMYEERAKQK